MVFLKEFLEKVDFEKDQQMTKNMTKFPTRWRVNSVDADQIAYMHRQRLICTFDASIDRFSYEMAHYDCA